MDNFNRNIIRVVKFDVVLFHAHERKYRRMLSIMGLHLKYNFMQKTQRFEAAFTVHVK